MKGRGLLSRDGGCGDEEAFSIEKNVTASQDDGFVEGSKTSGCVCGKHETIEKSQALGMTVLLRV